MASSGKLQRSGGHSARSFLYAALLAAAGLFVIYTAARALLAAFVNDDFPESLAIKVELMPVIFPVHMVSGALALLLVPLALALRRYPHWHRLAGRVAAIDVLVAGLTAFPVALVAPVAGWSAAGFAAQGAVWLVLLGLGYANVRLRRIAAHRACMLLMLATTSGAVFFRIYLALFSIYGSQRHFELFYACDAWMAWLLPLGITAFLLKRAGALTANPR